MHTVIRGTKTVEEFKALRQKMLELTERFFDTHRQAFENWGEGLPEKSWIDSDGNLCIEYESGNYWHYKETESGIEWW